MRIYLMLLALLTGCVSPHKELKVEIPVSLLKEAYGLPVSEADRTTNNIVIYYATRWYTNDLEIVLEKKGNNLTMVKFRSKGDTEDASKVAIDQNQKLQQQIDALLQLALLARKPIEQENQKPSENPLKENE